MNKLGLSLSFLARDSRAGDLDLLLGALAGKPARITKLRDLLGPSERGVALHDVLSAALADPASNVATLRAFFGLLRTGEPDTAPIALAPQRLDPPNPRHMGHDLVLLATDDGDGEELGLLLDALAAQPERLPVFRDLLGPSDKAVALSNLLSSVAADPVGRLGAVRAFLNLMMEGPALPTVKATERVAPPVLTIVPNPPAPAALAAPGPAAPPPAPGAQPEPAAAAPTPADATAAAAPAASPTPVVGGATPAPAAAPEVAPAGQPVAGVPPNSSPASPPAASASDASTGSGCGGSGLVSGQLCPVCGGKPSSSPVCSGGSASSDPARATNPGGPPAESPQPLPTSAK